MFRREAGESRLNMATLTVAPTGSRADEEYWKQRRLIACMCELR
jgi:hypothetical protein